MARMLRCRDGERTGEAAALEFRTRRSRLAAIAEEYTEEIHDCRTAQQLAGMEPVLRFAAVTSPGPSDSEESRAGNLIVADTADELAELLREECGEGWLAHGRAWDLDAPWHSWGNLSVVYSVRVLKETNDNGQTSAST